MTETHEFLDLRNVGKSTPKGREGKAATCNEAHYLRQSSPGASVKCRFRRLSAGFYLFGSFYFCFKCQNGCLSAGFGDLSAGFTEKKMK